MKATKNINIYLIDKKPVKAIDVVQYDTGIQLVFTVKDFGIPGEATATLYVQKPSGKFVYQTDGITISGDTVTISLDNQALTEHGKVPYQVTITSGSDTVTSFSGLMLVERKLSDAGATESKTVLKAFDELTADKLAELQERAETAASGVIATIPEDYTEMTAKVNGLANAIKGSLSGAVVRADDVSPVEHLPVVKVHGKNLFNISKVITDHQNQVINNGNETLTVNTSATSAAVPIIEKTLKELAPHIKVGEVYTLSANSTGTQKQVWFNNSGYTWKFGSSVIVTQEMLDSLMFMYASGNSTTAIISNIQIEKGDTATEYTPYVDPSTVKVTAGGVTYTPNADGTINGISSTVLADGISTEAEGITIECEYNKDTNKVISKLVNAISAMGGEVTI